MANKDKNIASINHIEQLYRTLRTAIRVAGCVGVAYIFRDSLATFAGQTTKVGLELSVLGDIKFAISISLAGVASCWAIAERKLRHRKVAKLQGRIRQLEESIDPGRTTSGLTTAGKTHPRDRD